MLKMNALGTSLLGALTLAFTLTLGTAHAARAEDQRAPMVRSDPHPTDRGSAMVYIAQARSGARQRRDTAQQRSGAMERREPKRPAPARERSETTRAGSGTPPRSR
jgi:hypothetical protein